MPLVLVEVCHTFEEESIPVVEVQHITCTKKCVMYFLWVILFSPPTHTALTSPLTHPSLCAYFNTQSKMSPVREHVLDLVGTVWEYHTGAPILGDIDRAIADGAGADAQGGERPLDLSKKCLSSRCVSRCWFDAVCSAEVLENGGCSSVDFSGVDVSLASRRVFPPLTLCAKRTSSHDLHACLGLIHLRGCRVILTWCYE